MIEIQLTNCLLVLKESELRLMLTQNPVIWKESLQRGKGVKRSRQAAKRVPKYKNQQYNQIRRKEAGY